MTVNGWLQIGFFLLAILAVTPLIGRFITRVFNREWTWLDPVLRPVERLIYRSTGVDQRREMRWTNPPRFCCSACLDATAVSDAARAAVAAVESGDSARFRPPRLQHRGLVHHQHQLAYGGEATMSYFTQMAGLAT